MKRSRRIAASAVVTAGIVAGATGALASTASQHPTGSGAAQSAPTPVAAVAVGDDGRLQAEIAFERRRAAALADAIARARRALQDERAKGGAARHAATEPVAAARPLWASAPAGPTNPPLTRPPAPATPPPVHTTTGASGATPTESEEPGDGAGSDG